MTRSYKQLDILERQRIYFLRKQGFSLRKIAEDLSRSPSTISREVKRKQRRERLPFRPGAAQGQTAGHRGVLRAPQDDRADALDVRGVVAIFEF